MSYLKFSKEQLVNLEYSLRREFLRTNQAGTYGNTTIIGCNTSKYHGLVICPVPELDNDRHVLLSGIDPTVVYNGCEFNLGIRKYSGGTYNPKGHKYIEELTTDVLPQTIYDIGGVKLSQEQVVDDNGQRVLIKYTVVETDKSVTLRLKPMLAFRSIHKLSHANMYVNTRSETVENGIRVKLYDGYPYLYMQTNKHPEFIQMPDWYYNVEYQVEQERGYDYIEDLFSPGYFETRLHKGESIVFSGGTELLSKGKIKRELDSVIANRIPRINYENCIYTSAYQFVNKQAKETYILSGFPWHSAKTRDTLISIPGLALGLNDIQLFIDTIDTVLKKLDKGLFPQILDNKQEDLTKSSDTPLWLFYSLQQLYEHIEFNLFVNKYWTSMESILNSYCEGTDFNIRMSEHYLISHGNEHHSQTWMNSRTNDTPVVHRKGFAVEVNALWYNALCFALEVAEKAKKNDFIKKWQKTPEIIKNSFIEMFWIKDENYLADYCTTQYSNTQIRPNQIIAAALPYSPLSEEQKVEVINCIKHKLLTKKGLRTLSPADANYQPFCKGTHNDREIAFHQGTVHAWLLEFYAKAIVSVYKKDALMELNKIYYGFEECMTEGIIGSISEVYDGNPPHQTRGAGSQAWSISMLLQIKILMDKLID